MAFPLDLIFYIVDLVEDASDLIHVSLSCKACHRYCAPRVRWTNVVLRNDEHLAKIILAVREDVEMAKYTETVVFLGDRGDVGGSDRNAILDRVWNKRERPYAPSTASNREILWNHLPEQLISELTPSHSANRSYAISSAAIERSHSAFMQSWPMPDEATMLPTVRCLCVASGHGVINLLPRTLHLYGSPTQWTWYGGPGERWPMFLHLYGIREIIFSITPLFGEVTGVSHTDQCNVFNRCMNYEDEYGIILDGVIVRVVEAYFSTLWKTYEASPWTRKSTVQFRLWKLPAGCHLPIQTVRLELTNGTWHRCLDHPGILGEIISIQQIQAHLRVQLSHNDWTYFEVHQSRSCYLFFFVDAYFSDLYLPR